MIDYDNKKEIILRNILSSLGGLIVMYVVILLAPLYSIFEELRVTYISNTLSQINTIYLCIIAAILVVVFAVGFYIVKGIFTIIVNIRVFKINSNM